MARRSRRRKASIRFGGRLSSAVALDCAHRIMLVDSFDWRFRLEDQSTPRHYPTMCGCSVQPST